ncbi:hypothetical protein [Kitasatospora sp. NBC_01300]|uniref:hypothetical protein n=1 Tax=Kitasatospora sp. NBC_01300 TaxID=2903574 RepID=UPI00352E8061|nr:hypothetical protein OG556_01945 [Kitasatospora sp. NBC_01300]
MRPGHFLDRVVRAGDTAAATAALAVVSPAAAGPRILQDDVRLRRGHADPPA